MNIVARARVFVESLRRLGRRTEWERRQCPTCGSNNVHKHGSYTRRPYTSTGRKEVRVQRYCCQDCGATHSETLPELVIGSWYAREVQRYTIDMYLDLGSSFRRVAEWVRSEVGRQERWHIWHPLSAADGTRCRLGASTVHRWLHRAGARAESQREGMHAGITSSGQMGTDGLWERLRGGTVCVVLMLRDSVSGLLWPPVVAAGEETAAAWGAMFTAARDAGLQLEALRVLVSDGAQGLASYLRQHLPNVYHQRCIFHFWRNLAREFARQVARAAEGLTGEAAESARAAARNTLGGAVHRIIDASSFGEAEQALNELKEHPFGAGLWKLLNERFDQLLAHLMDGHRQVGRVSPEWCWRDLRLRLSHGRNHGNERCLSRFSLVWSIYRNFTPAQDRKERSRHYRHPGKSALEVAGISLDGCSYLDALQV